jgi:hypothetical protein
LTLVQLIDRHFFRILQSDLEYFVLPIRLEEFDLIALLQRAGENPDERDDTAVMIVAILMFSPSLIAGEPR